MNFPSPELRSKAPNAGDKACLASWETGEAPDRIRHRCLCAEFWPIREQREDSIAVREWSVSFGGGLTLELDRRVTTELWVSLRAGQRVTLEVEAEVVAKGFKQHKDWGLIETRKLSVQRVHLDELDVETGEIR